MRRLFLLFALASVCFVGYSQKKYHVIDTVRLQEIVHYGDLKLFQTGAKIEQIESKHFELAQEGGLENILSRYTPIYVKSYAGGLATIRFRGTSSNHTSINFGGINVNSLTLGHSNVANISTFLFDGIKVQYGSSSAVNGSGSIGGAIFLGLNSSWTKGLRLSTKATIGSFGENLFGAKVFAGNGKWELVSRLYNYNKKNNFSFLNNYTADFENPGSKHDVQKGASIDNKGFLQEFNYRFRNAEFWKSSIWVEDSWHQVQPNMQSNYKFKATQEIDNNNTRVWSEYTNNRHKIQFYGGLGFVKDKQIYDNNGEQIITTKRLVSELTSQYKVSKTIGLKVGAKYRYIVPEVYSYFVENIKSEKHLELFVSSYYNIAANFKATLNLRQMFVSNFKAPFTPSLGLSYFIRTSDESFLKITSNLAKSYRIPTFNDRFWGDQGNPDLKPEKGNNFELGLHWGIDKNKLRSNLKINTFYMDIDELIEWRNLSGEWRARNVSKVETKGIELHGDAFFPFGKFEADVFLNYTWNPSVIANDIGDDMVVGRQLIYVPEHVGNIGFGLGHKKWSINIDGNYTGFRYIDYVEINGNYETVPGYFLANCALHYKLHMQKHKFNLTLSANNILDANYQNQYLYAMPGVSFRFIIKYDINILNN